MIDLHELTALHWVKTAGLGRIDFGCDPLSPADFDKYAASLFGLVAGVGSSAAAESRDATVGDLEQMQIICCLTVKQARQTKQEPQDIRLVLNKSDEDPDAGRLWVGRLPIEDVSHIAGAAMTKYVQAAQRAARFRRGPETAAHAGRDSETLRTDACDVSGEE